MEESSFDYRQEPWLLYHPPPWVKLWVLSSLQISCIPFHYSSHSNESIFKMGVGIALWLIGTDEVLGGGGPVPV